jgi:hypothetical protein
MLAFVRPVRRLRVAVVTASVVIGLTLTHLHADDHDRAAWMRTARFGVMTHYLADWIANTSGETMTVEKWNALIDGFDTEALAMQLESIGAGYYLITIGQNSGYYLAPNAAYDKIVGIHPSKCARRDLVADLAASLSKRNIKLMVYLPSGAPNGDAVAKQALQWQNGPFRNAEFQRKWEEIIREWSMRWGTKIAGWWFDGCYWPNTMYRSVEAPNFTSFAAAARAGNPASALAFNPGVLYRTISITPEDDYVAGEVDKPDQIQMRRATGGKADGAQIQMLSFLGQQWGRGAPRFTTDQVVAFTKTVTDAGGVVTWDTPIQRNGTFAQPFVDQLSAIGKALGAGRK